MKAGCFLYVNFLFYTRCYKAVKEYLKELFAKLYAAVEINYFHAIIINSVKLIVILIAK